MRVGRTPSVARSWLFGADVHVWATWAGVAWASTSLNSFNRVGELIFSGALQGVCAQGVIATPA